MNSQHKTFFILAFVAALILIPDVAFASGTTGTDGGEAIFGGVLNMIVGFCQGTLGKLIAIIAFLAGMIAGVAKGSFLAVLTGAGFAVVMYWGPQMILSFFGASI